SAYFILQRGDDLFCAYVDHLSGGRVGEASVQAEVDPAGLVTDFDAVLGLLRRHYRGVKDVQHAVGAVTEPDLFFVRRQADAVAGAAMPLDRALLVAIDLEPVELLARP